MAPHSSTLAWKILWTEEPGRLQSMGSRRVGCEAFCAGAWVQSLVSQAPLALPSLRRFWGSDAARVGCVLLFGAKPAGSWLHPPT